MSSLSSSASSSTGIATHFGGCLCTLVRYRILLPNESPMTLGRCSCVHCRKAVSSKQAIWITIPSAAISWATRQQEVSADQPPGYPQIGSGNAQQNEQRSIPWPYKEFRDQSGMVRGFCEWCGGGVLTRKDGESVVRIAAGSLDVPKVLEGVVVAEETCCGGSRNEESSDV
ncbi:hypothetical protein K440DRAFT_78064 [Wilcoxina mikolae CBS 423.85]|nr:hypothetical protein K440DRAFT_78064 [Wilcoxina mikolae CBS 423.85]